MTKLSNKYKTFNIHEKTSQKLYDTLNAEFSFTFDPCPLNKNPEFDGLTISWGKSCFINPPYGKAIRGWLEKALNEIEKGDTEIACFLLPAYPDVKWFHEIVLPYAHEIRFIKGRLQFGEHKKNAPFASMIVVFNRQSVLTTRQGQDLRDAGSMEWIGLFNLL